MENAQADVNPAKLFVGNLAYSVTEDQLRDLFQEYGEIIDLTILMDKYTHRSRGIGFIEFASAEQAEAAVEALAEKEFEGRNLMVNIAQPRTERPPRRNGGFGGGGRGGYGGGRGGNYGGGGNRGGRGGYGGNDRRGGYDRGNSDYDRGGYGNSY